MELHQEAAANHSNEFRVCLGNNAKNSKYILHA